MMNPFLVRIGPGIALGYVFALIWFLVMLSLAVHAQSALLIGLVFFGSIVGWTIGLLLTPVIPGQDIPFKTALGAAGTLATGFILAKFSDITAQVKVEHESVSMAIVIFGCTLVIGFLCVVIWRLEATRTPN
ncbi:MAG TPA: hypothetical protein VGU66_22350 [Candidatus Elarobacter sp.]|nr:hypothetical protein [Candidatus Elarobacter sp.]